MRYLVSLLFCLILFTFSLALTTFAQVSNSVCMSDSLAGLKNCVEQLRNRQVNAVELISQITCDEKNICDIDLSDIQGPAYFYGREGINAGFKRLNNYTYPLVSISGSSNITLSNLIFEEKSGTQCDNKCTFSTIGVSDSSNIILDRITIIGSPNVGISIAAVNNLVIQHSVIRNVGMFGIWSSNDSRWAPRNLIIQYNVFQDNDSNGVLISTFGTTQNPSLIVGNTFINNHRRAVFNSSGGQLAVQNSKHLVISDNIVINGSMDIEPRLGVSGIEAGGVATGDTLEDVLIANNDVHDHTDWGIVTNSWTNPTLINVRVTKNRVYNNQNSDIHFPGAQVFDNCFSPDCPLSPAGTINAFPNPCNISPEESTCASTITWSTKFATNVSVQVEQNIFSTNVSGSQNAPWITAAGKEFKLFSANTLLDSLVVGGKLIIPTPTPTPSCNLVSPVNLSSTERTATSVRLGWTPGKGGEKQLLRLAPNTEVGRSAVNSGCPDYPDNSPCLVKEDALPAGQANYDSGNIFVPETEYYWRVVEFKDSACWKDATAIFTTCSRYDINCDGKISIADIFHWRKYEQKNILDYLFLLQKWVR